jgi:hypothetical protein
MPDEKAVEGELERIIQAKMRLLNQVASSVS